MKKTIEIRSYDKSLFDSTVNYLQQMLDGADERTRYQKRLDEEKNVFLAYHKVNLVGICFLGDQIHEHRGHTLDIDIKSHHQSFEKDVYEAFFDMIEVYVHEKKVDFIATSALISHLIYQDVLKEKGFHPWFTLKKMIHDGRTLPHHDLSYRHYEDNDFDLYFQGLGDAFTPMRTAMDITPYNVCRSASRTYTEKERATLLKEQNRMYLFFEGNDYVGAVTIAGAEIDDFYIVDSYQGKGYGRKIINFSVNIAKELSKQPVFLTVVDWNEKAKNLYESVGFQTVEAKVFYRKLMHWN